MNVNSDTTTAANDDFSAELQEVVSTFPVIAQQKNYWLVRTQAGMYYESFYDYGYIAIEYDKLSYFDISKLKAEYGEERNAFIYALKDLCTKAYPEDKFPGLIASQIARFIYDIKKGDIVLIPSENSRHIAFGEVTSTPLLEVDENTYEITGCSYLFRKSVQWIKTEQRDNLDPYLYKMLQAHQAINNITGYAEIIERSLSNFFILEQDANLVLKVEKQGKISARELFILGTSYLSLLDGFAELYKLDISSADLEVKIALNSPGRIHFKSLNWKTVTVFGLIIIGINGGGLKINTGNFKLDLSTEGLIKKVSDYFDTQHDRAVQDTLIHQYKDSLKVKNPDDLLKLLQQSASNKNLPK